MQASTDLASPEKFTRKSLYVRPDRAPFGKERFVQQMDRWLIQREWAESLCGYERRLAGILSPRCTEEVRSILAAAAEAQGTVRLQPISRGKNWGFGSDVPVDSDTYLLDLSGLDKIRSSHIAGHSVELEPGVTQGQLDEWLAAQAGSHYFNVTGAGTVTSVIGNALERGIGYSGSRHTDLLELEVVLPGGQLIRTSKHAYLSRFGASLGPGVTDLFCQANFGVVTAARIALFRRPERMGAILCRVHNPADFAPLVSAVSDLIAEGACYGVPHIFNRERIVVSFAPHVDAKERAALAGTVAEWTALLPIKGSQAVFDATASMLKDRLSELGDIEVVSDQSEGATLSYLLQGRPTDFSHASVAYAVFGDEADNSVPPEESGAGLVHVAPLVPLDEDAPAYAVELARESLRKSGYGNPQLSMNVLTSRVAALIIPIGFDRRCAQDTAKAQRAAAQLVCDFAHASMLPYRLGLAQADLLPPMDEPWSRIFEQMQTIFDPTRCMATSRYESLWRKPLGKDNHSEATT